MKYNFGQKFYDVLLGAGENGGNLITIVLSSEQKHQLAMMQSTVEVHAELKNIRSNTATNVHYVQEMSDIKKYLRVKTVLWVVITLCLFLVLVITALLTVFAYNQQPLISESRAYPVCLISGVLGYLSFVKATKYRKQLDIMKDL